MTSWKKTCRYQSSSIYKCTYSHAHTRSSCCNPSCQLFPSLISVQVCNAHWPHPSLSLNRQAYTRVHTNTHTSSPLPPPPPTHTLSMNIRSHHWPLLTFTCFIPIEWYQAPRFPRYLLLKTKIGKIGVPGSLYGRLSRQIYYGELRGVIWSVYGINERWAMYL